MFFNHDSLILVMTTGINNTYNLIKSVVFIIYHKAVDLFKKCFVSFLKFWSTNNLQH